MLDDSDRNRRARGLRRPAEACAECGSPFTGLLCDVLGRSLDRSTELGRRVLDWPGRPDARGDSVPLRLAGGLHALVRRGRVPRLAALYPPNPAPRREALEGVVDLVKEVLDLSKPSRYAVRVWGDALRGRGILERDILIAKADESPLSAARAWRSCAAR